MKLLSKDSINSKKNAEMRQDIDVGLKIAARVDKVRETLAKESADLENFRVSTTKIVQEGIDSLIKRRTDLEHEVIVLEQKDSLLKKPFDEEWEKIRNARISELDARYTSLGTRERELTQRSNDLSRIESQFSLDKLRLEDLMDSARSKAVEAQQMYEDAEHRLRNAEARKMQMDNELEERRNAISKKELLISVQERDISNREESIRIAARELANKERAINDKYQTLLRTEERIKNNKK